jgi:uncharacterized coiled-coil protein SlyX
MPEDTAQTTEATPQPDELERLNAALAQRDARIATLEGELAAIRNDLKEARTAHDTAQRQANALKEALSAALLKYRDLLLASAPDIPSDLVKGDTLEELEASFNAAKQMVERIRSQVEAKVAKERVPAGSPIRSAPDLSALTPKEKILHALRQRP